MGKLRSRGASSAQKVQNLLTKWEEGTKKIGYTGLVQTLVQRLPSSGFTEELWSRGLESIST